MWDLKKSVFILNTRWFPKYFLYYSYQNFHAHLPEELFFDDFVTFFKGANLKTFKSFSKSLLPEEEEEEIAREKVRKSIEE